MQGDAYKHVNKPKEEVINDSITISSKLDLEIQNDFKTVFIMY